MFMVLSPWQSHCESSPGSFDECRTAPSGRRLNTKPDDLGCESACTGCQNLHPPSPFIIITQPVSWYSFYRLTEGRRLSRPSWLVTYPGGFHRRSPILVLTGSDVAQLRWSRPMRYQSQTANHNIHKKQNGCEQSYKATNKHSYKCRLSLWQHVNPLMGTLKPQSNGPLYSNTLVVTLAVNG